MRYVSFGVLLVFVLGGMAVGELRFSVVEVAERRKLVLDEPAEERELILVVRVEGEQVRRLGRVGAPRVMAVELTPGGELPISPIEADPEELVSPIALVRHPYPKPLQWGLTPQARLQRSEPGVDFPTGDTIFFRMRLPVPPREATAIQRLRGQVDMVVGAERHTVEGEMWEMGEPMEHPVLVEWGIEVRRGYFDAISASRYGAIGIKGSIEQIASITALDADGKLIGVESAVHKSPDGERLQAELRLWQSAPRDARLRIDILTEPRRETIDFELRDIPLP